MKKKKHNIAILDDYQGVALEIADWTPLREVAGITSFNKTISDRETLAETLQDFDIICTMRERTPIDKELLAKLPCLKLLTTTGMHNIAIDLEAASELGIVVCGTSAPVKPDGPIDMSDVVELTWGLILCLARQIPWEDKQMREGKWQTTIGTSLKGKNLGILGLGNLGKDVAAIGKAFGMNILAWSKNLTPEEAELHGAVYVEKKQFFSQSDVITVHLKLSNRTRNLIGENELRLMKSTALLVNTSRGPIVDESALLKSLERRQIGGAGLDVYNTEPLPADHPFLSLSNVVLSPHLGYVAEKTYREFYSETVDDIVAYMKGNPIRVLNP